MNKKCFSGKTVPLYPEEGFNELIFTLEPGKTAEFLTDTEIGLPVKWHFSAPGIKKNILGKRVKFSNNSNEPIKITANFLRVKMSGVSFLLQNLFIHFCNFLIEV